MNKKVKISLQMLTLLVGLFAGSQAVSAATFTVGNDRSVCPVVNFTRIQDAVNAAASGDIVNVCPGIYPEQVTIEKNLTLRGIQVGSNKLIIVRPTTVVANDGSGTTGINRARAAIILVRRAANATANPTVTVQNVVVDGINNNLAGCGTELYGIFYRNAGGTVIQNSVKNIRLNGADFGCQTGIGILSFPDDGNQTTYNLFVLENVIDNFQKAGVVVFGSFGSDALIGAFISRNTINGAGPTAQIGQNGIQLTDGITANSVISFNTISNLIFTGDTVTGSAGILLFDITTGLDVQDNNVNRTDSAIQAYGVSNTRFRVNDISNSVKFEGLILVNDGSIPSNNNTLTTNRVFNSRTTGIAVLGDNNTLSGNRVNDADIGIAANGNNTVTSSVINNTRLTQSIVTPNGSAATSASQEGSSSNAAFRTSPSFNRAER